MIHLFNPTIINCFSYQIQNKIKELMVWDTNQGRCFQQYSFINNFSSHMSGYDENQETVEFYKIQLMEKERVISSFEAKFKKAQIKSNRDIKQAKIAEEKAKNSLKEERIKLDKTTKKVHELTQQNNILQHRMAELKDQKDKEIDSVRSQYNHLKIEVRSYERILPTHTFLSQLGATIEQLPTYEVIFMNWKDKSQRFDEMDAKFKAFKEESQEKIILQTKVEESLKKSKNDLERQLRDDMTKLLEVESQITTYQMERDELANKLESTLDELQTALNSNEELTENNKALEAKLDEFITIHNTQMDAKQEQIKKITEEEARKFEEEMERIAQSYQIKENAHMQQLAFLEEQQMRLQEKNQKDKEKFQETYRELYNEVENLKRELQNEREELLKQKIQADKLKRQLEQKNEQNCEYLRKLGENQLKIEQLQGIVQANTEKLLNHKEKASESLEEVAAIRKQMQEKLQELEQQNHELHEELLHRENEIMALNSEIEDFRNRGQLMNRSSFPAAFFMEEAEVQRKRKQTEESVEIQAPLEVPNVGLKLLDVDSRNRKSSIISQQSRPLFTERKRKKSSAAFFTQEQLNERLRTLQQKILKDAEEKNKKLIKEKEKDNEEKLQEIEQQYGQEIKHLRKTIETLQFENKKLERDLATDKEFHEDELGKLKKMHDLLKAEKDAIEQSYVAHVLQAKRDKEVLTNIKKSNKEIQKANKELLRSKEQMQAQIDQLKKFKEKAEAKQAKQKASNSTQTSSLALKELMDKYNTKINVLIKEKDQQSVLISEKDLQIGSLNDQLKQKLKKYESIEADMEEKQREIRMLEDLLDHERKDRTLRTVPSLASLADQDVQEEENFKQFYNQAGQKEGQIAILERQIEALKEETKELKESNERKLNDMQNQMTEYIQQIIRMKMVVAESQMKASEKTHLYHQLKKKFSVS